MFGLLQGTVLFVLTTACFIVEVAAVIDIVRRPAGAFAAAGKRTKNFWLVLVGVTTAIGFLGLHSPTGYGRLGLMALFVAIPSFIYFADVRPAIKDHRGGPRGRNRNNRSGW